MNKLSRRRRPTRPKAKLKVGRRTLTKKPGGITGVCAGIGNYLNIDPVIVRAGFAIGTFMSFGTGLIIYLGLAAFLPEDEPKEEFMPEGRTRKRVNLEGLSNLFEEGLYQEVPSSPTPLPVCPNCDTVAKPSSKFCHNCGTKL
ncbi:MAG: PspC domain-containing protein [Bacteroidota bacterium]